MSLISYQVTGLGLGQTAQRRASCGVLCPPNIHSGGEGWVLGRRSWGWKLISPTSDIQNPNCLDNDRMTRTCLEENLLGVAAVPGAYDNAPSSLRLVWESLCPQATCFLSLLPSFETGSLIYNLGWPQTYGDPPASGTLSGLFYFFFLPFSLPPPPHPHFYLPDHVLFEIDLSWQCFSTSCLCGIRGLTWVP